MERNLQSGRYLLPGLLISCGVLLADQYTKWLVMETVLRPDGDDRVRFADWLTTIHKISFFINERETFGDKVLSPYLNLVMVWNQGISFGMMDHNSPHMPLVFTALSLTIALVMIVWLAMTIRMTTAAALGLIIGGALGNVMDRIRFDAVVDFLDFHYQRHHWPAFNAADSCIVLGAGILMLKSLFGQENARRRADDGK